MLDLVRQKEQGCVETLTLHHGLTDFMIDCFNAIAQNPVVQLSPVRSFILKCFCLLAICDR